MDRGGCHNNTEATQPPLILLCIELEFEYLKNEGTSLWNLEVNRSFGFFATVRRPS